MLQCLSLCMLHPYVRDCVSQAHPEPECWSVVVNTPHLREGKDEERELARAGDRW